MIFCDRAEDLAEHDSRVRTYVHAYRVKERLSRTAAVVGEV